MTAASRWFASVVGREALPAPGEWADGAGGPWPDVRRTLLTYRDEITATIASRSTQTNEVNRSVYVLTMLALAGADVSEPTTAPHLPGARLPLPVALVEPGCSAGLLMTPDRYDVRIGGDPALSWGDPGSGVHVDGDDRTLGDDVPLAARHVTPPPIVARVGLDLAPVRLDATDELRWLQACLWPDVPGRVERFEAAVRQHRLEREAGDATAGQTTTELLTGDITDPHALSKALQQAVRQAERAGHEAVTFGPAGHGGLAAQSQARREPSMPVVSPALHVVVLTSWAMTYVERSERRRIASVLGGFAASTGLPVTWCGAEPAGGMPGLGELPEPLASSSKEGITVLAARRWRAGREDTPIIWGTADPHGRWIRLLPLPR